MQEAEDGLALPRTTPVPDARARSRLGAGVGRFELAAVVLAVAGRRAGGAGGGGGAGRAGGAGGAWRFDTLGLEHDAPPDEVAGRALVELVELLRRVGPDPEIEAATLGRILRPDPALQASSWSVECYRIGDFAPHALRDHTSAASALAALSDCGDRSHVAARLVATAQDGLSWVAAVRTGQRVAFQLFGPDSVLPATGAASPGRDARVQVALAHWQRRLAHWHRVQGASGSFFVARCAQELSGLSEDELLQGAVDEDPAPEVGDGPAAVLRGAPSAAELFFEVAASLEQLRATVDRIARVVDRLELAAAEGTRAPRWVAGSGTDTPERAPATRASRHRGARGRSVADDPWTEAR